MKSIVIIIPYFGKWPFWFEYYLLSCKHNPSIHWLFYTDCGIPANAPVNVEFHAISFADYVSRVRECLQIDFAPETAYKLCDIRPAYGLIHQDAIRQFDYWGFGDIDVIYGDLRKYFNEERLRYQTISCIGTRLAGHLSLFQNNDRMRFAFKRIKHWRELMCGKHSAFDERQFSHLFLRRKNWPKWFRELAFSWDPLVRGALFEEAFATSPSTHIPWLDGSANFPKTWYWKPGSLTNDLTGAREFPYLHFVEWKQGLWRHLESSSLIHSSVQEAEQGFSIAADGFRALGA